MINLLGATLSLAMFALCAIGTWQSFRDDEVAYTRFQPGRVASRHADPIGFWFGVSIKMGGAILFLVLAIEILSQWLET